MSLFYLFSPMIFFWALFDGIISFITPIFITDTGFTNTQMGLIIAFSSLAGAIFDFVLTKTISTTHYRRLFIFVFILCFFHPFVLFLAKSALVFLFAMALWGLYYDLTNFAQFDFVARHSFANEHCKHSGIVTVFKSLGYLIAPVLAGLVITNHRSFNPLAFALLYLVIALLFFIVLYRLTSSATTHQSPSHYHRPNIFTEILLWRRLGHILLPVLLFNTGIYIFEATFWTIGPLFAKNFTDFSDFSGIFMMLYGLPPLLTGWFVENFTSRFGKKRTAYVSFLLGNFFLIPFAFVTTPAIVLVLVFLSSLINSFAWPAIKGAYVDYINESRRYQNEIVGLNDFSTNLGYIIGPIMAGALSDRIGIGGSFAAIGIFNIGLVISLFAVTPRHIRVALPQLK